MTALSSFGSPMLSSPPMPRLFACHAYMPATIVAKTPALPAFKTRFPEEDGRVLQAFLRFNNDDVKKSTSHYERVKKWRADLGPLTASDMEPYLRRGNYVTTLEAPRKPADGSREVIVYMNGMITGSREEMMRQAVFVAERAWAQICAQNNNAGSSTWPPKVQLVIDTRGPNFRYPDADFRALCNMMKESYPWLMHATAVFLDLPSFMHVPLKAVSRLVPSMRDRFKVMRAKDWIAQQEDLQTFLNHPSTKWNHADGGFVLDVDEYLRAYDDPVDTDAPQFVAQIS